MYKHGMDAASQSPVMSLQVEVMVFGLEGLLRYPWRTQVPCFGAKTLQKAEFANLDSTTHAVGSANHFRFLLI